jgi:hypothetical protein
VHVPCAAHFSLTRINASCIQAYEQHGTSPALEQVVAQMKTRGLASLPFFFYVFSDKTRTWVDSQFGLSCLSVCLSLLNGMYLFSFRSVFLGQGRYLAMANKTDASFFPKTGSVLTLFQVRCFGYLTKAPVAKSAKEQDVFSCGPLTKDIVQTCLALHAHFNL